MCPRRARNTQFNTKTKGYRSIVPLLVFIFVANNDILITVSFHISEIKMAIGERDLLTRLLKQSILTLCREAVAFRSRLEVDGIICLTVDDQDQHVVKIHEFFDRFTETETVRSSVRGASSECMASLSRAKTREAGKTQTENEELDRRVSEMQNTIIKSELHEDSESYETIRMIEDPARSDSQQEVKLCKRIGVKSLQNFDYSSMGLENLIASSAVNIPCKKCSSFLENASLLQVHNMTSHGQFTCLVCLATFTSRNNMKRHIRLHTGIKPYSCHKCSESFSRNDDFKRHLLKHTFQKPFRCAICNAGYSDRSFVKSHMINEHNSKVFHICPQCGESHTDSQKFQQHKKSHPEFQDYRCSLCSFTGSNALMYNKHMLTHGPQKEYNCTHCNLSYSDPFMYTGHLKKHKGDDLVNSFTCCFCDLALPSFEQFQRHEHTHVQSKQHTCKQCNKVFRYPSNLREHMLTHLNKPSFSSRNSSEQLSECTENFLLITKGECAVTAAVEQRSPSSDEQMDTEEENNNEVNTCKIPIDSEFIDRDSGSKEYWCTECSQGFGTESKLKYHISFKHEGKEVANRDDDADARQFDSLCFVIPTQPNGKAQPELLASYDSKDNRSRKPSNHEDDEGIPNKHLKVCSKGSHHINKKDIVPENTDSPSFLNSEGSDGIVDQVSDNNTETKLSTVKDAMKEVKNIQFRFGIKPRGKELLSSHTDDGEDIREDLDVVERSSSLSFPFRSNATLLSETTRQVERSMLVSVSGMKMKIQRTPFSLSKDCDKESTYSKDKVRNTDKLLNDCTNGKKMNSSESSVLEKDTNSSVAPSQGSSTKINLQIRNPGFERVVTPDVLFSTKAPFTCEVCEETFGSFDDFHEHGVKVHRRFICSYCGKVFTSRPNRERHIRYHTGEKPYKCDLCTASFLRGDDLKYHRTTKHADVKPFTCGACRTSFSIPKDLEKHLKMYSDHRV